MLDADSVNYFKTLKVRLTRNGAQCVHGSPPDSVSTYLHHLNKSELGSVFTASAFNLCFTGHTHRQEMIARCKQKITREPLNQEVQILNDKARYIINVGSVGQPRDGNPDAKYVIWDSEKKQLSPGILPMM